MMEQMSNREKALSYALDLFRREAVNVEKVMETVEKFFEWLKVDSVFLL